MMKLLCLCGVVLLTTGLVVANVKMSMPAPTPTIKLGKAVMNSTLEVVPDPRASEARLQIAQSTLSELRAENQGAANAPVAAVVGTSRTRTIVAGVFMFLAVSVAGVLIARKARASSLGRTQKAIVAIIVLGGLIGLAVIVTSANARANAGPPGSYRWRNLPQSLTQGRSLAAGVDVEIVPDNEMSGIKFRLIVPITNPKPGEE